jgi:hypothetical protein
MEPLPIPMRHGQEMEGERMTLFDRSALATASISFLRGTPEPGGASPAKTR